MEDKEKAIDVLNSLVVINNDRIEGYETASKETSENDLDALFSAFIEHSKKCKQELEAEVIKLGGKPAEGTKITGKFFRAWMDVKEALSRKERKTVLSSCEFGEDRALKEYERALDDFEYLNMDQQSMIRAQFELLKADHDKVKAMRDELTTA